MSMTIGTTNPSPGDLCMMFTDIEGSTNLLQSIGEHYPEVLTRHYKILSNAIDRHDGHLVKTAGDGVFAVFENPGGGLHSAIDAQRALHVERWPSGCKVRVRMGLHTGEVQALGDDYVGLEVHRAARISSSSHGGQIVLSNAVRSCVPEETLPNGAKFRDLGSHRLKDLRYPEKIFDLTIKGLPDEFPPLRSLGARRTNLPSSPTELVGRVEEKNGICRMLTQDGCRLVTLTGPGGTGKTSLALAIAQGLQGNYSGGAYWVQLGEVSDADLVASAVTQSLGFQETPGISPADVIINNIGDARFLLVLDTFEHVIDAARLIPELLDGCPNLSILVTSRELLSLQPEVVYQVPTLSTPKAGDGVEEITSRDSVKLFVERVRDKRPDFDVNAENAGPIARICRRLDGLPLAIELAAARGALLDPEMLADRLVKSLDILKDRRRDLDPRHRALRQTIAWSDDLLSETERRLFRRVSVFSGGFDIEAAEDVLGEFDPVDLDVLDGLESLISKSLLRRGTALGRPRLFMLDTIREYALEGMASEPDYDAVLAGHAAYYQDVAASAAPHVLGDGQRAHVERLYKEAGNIRAALSWAFDQPDGEAAGHLLEKLKWFWISRGHFSEAQSWTNLALEKMKSLGESRSKAAAFNVASWIRYASGDYAGALEPAVESRRIFEALGDKMGMASVGIMAGIAKAVAGQVPEGPELIFESRELFRELGEVHGAAIALIVIGEGARAEGDLATAETCQREALELLEETRNTFWPGLLFQNFAHYRLREGDWAGASTSASKAMAYGEEYDYPMVVILSVMAKGGVALAKDDARLAARIFGATQAMLDKLGTKFEPTDQEDFDRYLAGARETIGDADFAAAASAGASAPWGEIIAEARAL